ncbi:uncharacterized protein WM277_014843 isoform 1-T1 [Molossus nigricans]
MERRTDTSSRLPGPGGASFLVLQLRNEADYHLKRHSSGRKLQPRDQGASRRSKSAPCSFHGGGALAAAAVQGSRSYGSGRETRREANRKHGANLRLVWDNEDITPLAFRRFGFQDQLTANRLHDSHSLGFESCNSKQRRWVGAPRRSPLALKSYGSSPHWSFLL